VPRNFERETTEALSTLRSLLPADVNAVAGVPSLTLNGSHDSRGGLLDKSLEFQAILVADLVHARKFDDKASWIRCVGIYLTVWTDSETGIAFSEAVRSHYHVIDQASHENHVCSKFSCTSLGQTWYSGQCVGRRRSIV
jgi:elongation factor 3